VPGLGAGRGPGVVASRDGPKLDGVPVPTRADLIDEEQVALGLSHLHV